jgi:hypothetical protein
MKKKEKVLDLMNTPLKIDKERDKRCDLTLRKGLLFKRGSKKKDRRIVNNFPFKNNSLLQFLPYCRP